MLKKIMVLAITTLLIQGAQSASWATYDEVLYMCPKAPYPVGGPMSKFFSSATGTNFVLTKFAELSAQKELKKQLNSKFNVELHAFGGKNLIDGKFKGINLTSKQIASDELNVTNFSANSLCGYNRVTLKDDNIYFLENFLMEFSAQITDDDLQRAILSPSYQKLMRRFDFNIIGFNVFKLTNPTIAIRDNRLKMSVRAIGPSVFAPNYDIDVDTSLKVENGKIIFSDIKLAPLGKLNLNSVLPVINRMNPFVFKVALDKNNIATIKFKNVKIENNQIYVKGLVIVPKTPVSFAK